MAVPHDEWQKYPKIPLVSPDVTCVDDMAVVTEKIHGANFSIIVRGPDKPVEFAKRSGVLADSDDFYSFRSQGLATRLAALARRAWDLATSRSPLSLTIYGELCGGHYPHPSVEAAEGIRPVQRGVWYSPSLCFVCFDVAIVGSSSPHRFLDYDDACQLCDRAGFLFAQPLMVGPMHACVHDHPQHFGSTLPSRLGLPPLQEPNYAEGVVIRPIRERASGVRHLVKRKIPEFSETQYTNKDWRTSRAGSAGGAADPRAAREQTEATDVVKYEMLAHVNENRLHAALSKIGRVDPTARRAYAILLAELEADVVQALVDDGVITSASGFGAELKLQLREAARDVVIAFLREERKARCTMQQQQHRKPPQ